MPGANTWDKEKKHEEEEVKNSPVTARFIKNGVFTVNEVKTGNKEKAVNDYNNMKSVDLIELVEETLDVDTLKEMKKGESRKGVLNALEKQFQELTGDPEGTLP
jgi:hypothetical protein